MLHGDILVLHARGDALGGVQRPVHIPGDIDLVGLMSAAGYPGLIFDLLLHSGPEAGHGHAGLLQQLRGQPLRIRNQGVEQVALFHLRASIFRSRGLRGLQDLGRFLRIIELTTYSSNLLWGEPFSLPFL